MSIKSFFAAANGYDGFRSDFNNVFSIQKIDKLFVIKGGPGTGKSTLMKKISELYKDKSNITHIYCSSDANSLDGIVVENNRIRIGIADGTSPHVIEPVYPGVFEEIINLGDGFEYHKLYNFSKQIIELDNLKKHYYKKAYNALYLAGRVHKYILSFLLDSKIYIKAEQISKMLISDLDITKSDMINNGFLLSAFCKDGYIRLNNPTCKKTIEIRGDGISEYILMSELNKKLLQHKSILHIYPSAFSNDYCDCIETDKYIFTVNNNSSEAFYSNELINNSLDYEHVKNIYDNLLDEAKSAFKMASNVHFKLEDIYSKSISFEKNEDKYERITEEINYIFKK